MNPLLSETGAGRIWSKPSQTTDFGRRVSQSLRPPVCHVSGSDPIEAASSQVFETQVPLPWVRAVCLMSGVRSLCYGICRHEVSENRFFAAQVLSRIDSFVTRYAVAGCPNIVFQFTKVLSGTSAGIGISSLKDGLQHASQHLRHAL